MDVLLKNVDDALLKGQLDTLIIAIGNTPSLEVKEDLFALYDMLCDRKPLGMSVEVRGVHKVADQVVAYFESEDLYVQCLSDLQSFVKDAGFDAVAESILE